MNDAIDAVYPLQYLSGDSPYLPGVANLSCVLFFALSFVNVLHVQVEVSVSVWSVCVCVPVYLSMRASSLLQVVLSSCVFLLLQPDGSFIPESKGVFPAPSVLASVFGLYCLSASRLASTLLSLPTFYSTNALSMFVLRTANQLLIQLPYMHRVCFGRDMSVNCIARTLHISVLPVDGQEA